MTLQERIELMVQLGEHILANGDDWKAAKQKASAQNPWFVPEFIEAASGNIAEAFLNRHKLTNWVNSYPIPLNHQNPKKVGLVMAGNIPMVGFHDMLCIFVSGHYQAIKLSAKDPVLITHLVKQLISWDAAVENYIAIAERINGCDAYIATGSNNSGRYFEYYFGKYPHIIRRNRTSVAIVNGNETADELVNLADDIQQYFGLGCRNVTKIYVPAGYHFEPLLSALNKYSHYSDFHKYRHNYDYQLALLMMGNRQYMTNGSILLSENAALFSAVSQLHFEYYTSLADVENFLINHPDVQCVAGQHFLPFGSTQQPSLTDYADGVDTLSFLHSF